MSAIIIPGDFANANLPSNLPLDEQILAAAGLHSWWQFDPLYVTYGTSPAISSLANRSATGGALAQATSGKRPNLNGIVSGYPAAVFDGSDDVISAASQPSFAAPFSFVCLFTPDATLLGTSQAVMGSWTSGGTQMASLLIGTSSQLRLQIGVGVMTFAPVLVGGATYLVIGGSDGVSAMQGRLYRVSSTERPAAAAGTHANATGTNTFVVGALNTAGGSVYRGSVSEAMIWTVNLFDTAHTATLELLESFFRQVYGVKIT